jgi:hypothetical protein
MGMVKGVKKGRIKRKVKIQNREGCSKDIKKK